MMDNVCQQCGNNTVAVATWHVCPVCHGWKQAPVVFDGAEIYFSRTAEALAIVWNHTAPIGKPRQTRKDKWAKRPPVVRYRAWSTALALAVKGVVPAPEQVDRLDWVAWFAVPESWSDKRQRQAIGTPHRAKPDRDNVDKSILDTLFPAGDSAISDGTISKRWGWIDGLEIVLRLLPADS